jgi:membrane-bound serine protease (ClpP class)
MIPMRRLLAWWVLLLSVVGVHAAPAIVYVIPVRDEIEQTMVYLVRRGVREAAAQKADILVLNMNTNGGRTDAMEEIVRAVESFPHQDKTYTYIDKKAASAGAFIASSTRHIYMAPGSVIGAATPVMLSSSHEVQALPESYEKKITSFFEATGRATAERHGHDPAVFAAMVDRNTGLTVDGQVIAAKGTVLTLTNTEAEKKYGMPPRALLSEGTAESLDALVARIAGPDARVTTISPTGFERVARLFTLIAPFLLTAGMILGYLEFKTQGGMLFGILAAICFLVFFFGSYVAGLSGYEPVVLFLLGVALIAVEIAFFPGLVLPVATGLVLVVAAILFALANPAPGRGPIPSLAELGGPLLTFFATIALAIAGVALLARFVPQLPWARPLERATVRGAGFDGTPTASENLVRLGDAGETLTHLRPAGTARFGDRRIDVVSDGAFVPPGTPVRVVGIEGIRVVVKAVTE